MILLNPPPDRQSQDLNRVFFTSSHVVVALFAGYGVALLAGLPERAISTVSHGGYLCRFGGLGVCPFR